MKKMYEKIKSAFDILPKLEKILIVIFSILFSIYFIFSLFSGKELILVNLFTKYFIFGVLLLFFLIIFFFVSITFLLNLKYSYKNKKVKRIEFIGYMAIVFSVLSLYFIAYYPAGMSPDSANQWMQVQNSTYSDWHPIMHTLVFFRLPTLIWNNPASCTIFQILFISTIVSYTCYSLRKFGISKKLILIFLMLFLIHPSNGRMAVTLWKDIPYSYCILSTTVMLMWIHFTNGNWIRNWKNILLFSLSLLGILFFRHNGILVFIPISIFLIYLYKDYRKYFILLSILILVVKFIVTGPLYSALDFSKHSSGFREAMGVPCNQISTIYNKGGVVLEKELNVMSQIAPLEDWKKYYDPTNFNRIKWSPSYSETYIQDNSKVFIKTWYSMVIRNPYLAVNSFYNVTKCIWGFNYNQDTGSPSIVNREELSKYVVDSPVPLLKRGLEKYRSLITGRFSYSFMNIIIPGVGFSLFLIIYTTFIGFLKNKKSILIMIPVLFNSLSIMLLITGGELRFVYANIITYIPIVLFQLLINKNTLKKGSK